MAFSDIAIEVITENFQDFCVCFGQNVLNSCSGMFGIQSFTVCGWEMLQPFYSPLFLSKVKRSDWLKALIVTTSDWDPCCQMSNMIFSSVIALLSKGYTVWDGFFSVFVAQKALLCRRERRKYIPTLFIQIKFYTCSCPNVHVQWLNVSFYRCLKKSPSDSTKEGVRRMEMSNAAQAATVKPRNHAHACMATLGC